MKNGNGKSTNGNGNGKTPNGVTPKVRCAIYTRKSTEEGLDQEFNSLDAQREAAESYIASQRHEGWEALPNRYDDGGFSGGNMDRPALQRLLQDIEEDRAYVSRLLHLTLLAPDIIEAILYGREPSGLSLARLNKAFPSEWEEQRRELGFPEPSTRL